MTANSLNIWGTEPELKEELMMSLLRSKLELLRSQAFHSCLDTGQFHWGHKEEIRQSLW